MILLLNSISLRKVDTSPNYNLDHQFLRNLTYISFLKYLLCQRLYSNDIQYTFRWETPGGDRFLEKKDASSNLAPVTACSLAYPSLSWYFISPMTLRHTLRTDFLRLNGFWLRPSRSTSWFSTPRRPWPACLSPLHQPWKPLSSPILPKRTWETTTPRSCWSTTWSTSPR